MGSKLHKWLRNYFGFSSTESRGFLVLLVLLLGLLASPFLLDYFPQSKPTDQATLDSAVAQLKVQADSSSVSVRKENYDHRDYDRKSGSTRTIRLFPFDPNQISGEQWQELGLPRWMAERIVKYRSKGGVFRRKEDLLRIYDFPEEQYRTLEPYIQLPEVSGSHYRKPAELATKEPYEPKKYEKKITTFELNEADTTALKSVYGIGSKLAIRILKFRESLGGFTHTAQLREVWGLDSTVVDELLKRGFVSEHTALRKIRINEINAEQLRHPYLKPYIAKAIIAYRQQHGNFQSVADLKPIKLLDEATLKKLEPYLAF